jgi:hypothetical protein
LVPTENDGEVLLRFGVVNHPLKLRPLLGLVAADGRIEILADDSAMVLFGQPLDFLPLPVRARLLLGPAHADIGHRGR